MQGYTAARKDCCKKRRNLGEDGADPSVQSVPSVLSTSTPIRPIGLISAYDFSKKNVFTVAMGKTESIVKNERIKIFTTTKD